MENIKFYTKKWAEEITRSPVLYPDERLVAFLKRYLASNSQFGKKALDIGFGSGRHLKLLSELGFDTYGIDVLDEAKELVKINFNEFPLDKIIISDYTNTYFDENFDVIILWGSIFLTPFSQIVDNLIRVKNILNNGGRVFLNFRSDENWFKGLGKEVEYKTYLLDERANEYKGFLYSFVSKEDIIKLISDSGLSLLNLERLDLWKNNLTQQNSWFVCEVIKT